MAETTNQGLWPSVDEIGMGPIPGDPRIPSSGLGTKISDSDYERARKCVNAVERHLGGDASLVGELVGWIRDLYEASDAEDASPHDPDVEAAMQLEWRLGREILAKIGRA